MAITNNRYFNWISSGNYSKWDVVYGAFAGDTYYYYSTADSNNGAATYPRASFLFTAAGTVTRSNNVIRLPFTQTGAYNLQPGSVVAVSGLNSNLAAADANYTGVVLAAGTGYIDYLNPGPDGSWTATQGKVFVPIHPYWTTGFYWIPSWSSDITHNQQVITAQMGEGYSQRTNPAINANVNSWTLVFDERTDKETNSLLTFAENQGGVTPFKCPFPVGSMYNNPAIKYIGGPCRHRLSSFGLNSVSLGITQVFDIG